MKTPLGVTRTPARTRLSALGKLTVAAVLGLPLLLSTGFVVNGLNVTNLLITGIALILAAIITAIIVATRWRWSPLLGALVYAAILAASIPIIPYALSHPNETYMFALTVVLLALSVIALGAGIGATVWPACSSSRSSLQRIRKQVRQAQTRTESRWCIWHPIILCRTSSWFPRARNYSLSMTARWNTSCKMGAGIPMAPPMREPSREHRPCATSRSPEGLASSGHFPSQASTTSIVRCTRA